VLSRASEVNEEVCNVLELCQDWVEYSGRSDCVRKDLPILPIVRAKELSNCLNAKGPDHP
jgi:hypothetical protein